MNLLIIIKYIFFLFHILGIFITIFSVFFYWQVLIAQIITILSWKLNQNKCIITQIENYLFKETIIDCYFKYIIKKNPSTYTKYIVPWYQRYFLYISFIIGSIYHTLT